MDLKSLKIFVETVNSQSFSLAAVRLFMTQPTLSKIIKSLEEELGTALFKKGEAGRKREVVLTYTGELIYQHALNILSEHEKIYNTIEQVKLLKKGKLTLGLPPLGSVLFSSLIALFHKQHPDIQLSFLEVGSNSIEEAIADKRIDVGILLGNFRPTFASIPVVDSAMCLLSIKDSQWRNRKTVNLVELKEESFLLFSDTFTLNSMIIKAANTVGFEPKVVCKSSQWDFIAKMVESNMGIALLPQIYCQQLDQEKFNTAVLENPGLNWTLSMAWNTTIAMSPATRAWLNIVKDHKQKIHF
ncbi:MULTISPECIES: LysR family transcriptional regulator [Acinetobacter]|jgi:DNA-binding transcriptional LysR family regulator|uniref:LysR family transcriptional regulator n=2 Tax=Acinetobacter variabilis TaxID=70346 RepID=A0A7T8AS75_9GAMM|nr:MULTISPECIES: LysR family transcriptional regulator [Acinetobacter]KMU99568.1 LysR family transcriptional regulator [Acinetobacter sp. VT 511]MCU4631041.1 LysR family transcriptional regulator [Acinetobacter variabilis]NHB66206.1 LysR family transcriptional regulator [Acinetobacter sp. GFQ9D191M]NHC00455.1 LysR family transcriptional regulator [Acinetobacter sp. GFQ9D192M]QQN89694.1 LysR family transcriptional regulator [Acinetobacter variabilis]